MSFSLEDRYNWDFWTAFDGVNYHLFFLNAPRHLPDPEHRHFYASVGHAVSGDLVNWKEVQPALAASAAPAWDDGAIWTGSVIRRPDGRWMMFYTGICRGEKMLIQRIGAAISDDLLSWKKLPSNPILMADPSRHETLDRAVWPDQAFRDPWVFQAPGDARWHMVFTTRRPNGLRMSRGTIGHAVSDDLETWTHLPTLYEGDEFGQLEVLQIFPLAGRWYCLFCTTGATTNPDYLARAGIQPASGTHYLVADTPLGPWRLLEDRFLAGDANWSLYAGRVVFRADGSPLFLAFVNNDRAGRFVGGLIDPIPLTVLADGRLRVDASMYGIK